MTITATEQASDSNAIGDTTTATTKISNGGIIAPFSGQHNGYEGWTAAGLGVSIWTDPSVPAVMATRTFEAGGATVTASDTASSSLQTVTTSDKVSNGYMGVYPFIAPFSDISQGGYSISGLQILDAVGDTVTLGASGSSSANLDLGLLYGGSVSANSKLQSGEFIGFNLAGPIEGPAYLMAGQEPIFYVSGSVLTLDANAQSTSGQQDHQTLKVLNPTGFGNIAGVNLYDGSIYIGQGGE